MTTQPCRACGTPILRNRLELGSLRISDFPPLGTDLATLPRAPLTLAECPKCSLVQLTHTVSRQQLFTGDYWYASGINGLMREELRRVVRRAREIRPVADQEWVLDLGANDGTLLRAWHDHLWEGRPRRIAVEPSPTFARPLHLAAECVIQDLFPSPMVDVYAGQIAVATSIAMFYSVEDPVGFAQGVRRLLRDDGLWVIQFQDLLQMLEAGAVDNICHEHLTYPSLTSLLGILHQADFCVSHVERTPINGGSLRVFARPAGQGWDMGGSIDQYLVAEAQLPWGRFLARYQQAIHDLRETVAVATDAPHYHLVDLLGASTKGNTLLQLAGITQGNDRGQVRWAWERHPEKIGRQTVTGVPIVGEAQGREFPPHLLICPIWQFRTAVIEREAAYLQAGGRIYFPLPVGEIVQWGGGGGV